MTAFTTTHPVGSEEWRLDAEDYLVSDLVHIDDMLGTLAREMLANTTDAERMISQAETVQELRKYRASTEHAINTVLRDKNPARLATTMDLAPKRTEWANEAFAQHYLMAG